MKVCVIQPPYSSDYNKIDECFNKLLSLMDECDTDCDLIVLPEYSDVLATTPDEFAFVDCIKKYSPQISQKASDLAKRCNAIVCANFGYKTDKGYRNTTHVFDRSGNEVGLYFKAHPAPSEIRYKGIDTDYANELKGVYTVTVDGIKLAFRTCYDFYFYEDLVEIAREKPDIIIGCSYQRTDTHDALSIINKFVAYNTNAYLVRASISLGKDSNLCGCSCIITPKGDTLVDMKSEVGIGCATIDVNEKYYKPSGFAGSLKSHPEYVDEGRYPSNSFFCRYPTKK